MRQHFRANGDPIHTPYQGNRPNLQQPQPSKLTSVRTISDLFVIIQCLQGVVADLTRRVEALEGERGK